LDEPELKTSAPLTPVVPLFALRIVTTPLDVDVPSPLLRLTAPPVCTVLRPAEACTDPPTPLVPLPTVISTMPARPSVDTPVPISIEPELPPLAVPVLKISMPLTPVVPELMDRIVMVPLDVDVPSPLLKLMAPPVCTVLRPAYI
jgi:hypothetical protein